MDTYAKIEKIIADEYQKDTTTKKAVGDFMLEENHAVNVKSNNLDKQNYSPNMISIQKMHKWVFEEKKELSFIFVDYVMNGDEIIIRSKTKPIPIEHLSWDCLSIEAQGYGVIQLVGQRTVHPQQTKREFYLGFLTAYKKFRKKEEAKHDRFSKRFITDTDTIDW